MSVQVTSYIKAVASVGSAGTLFQCQGVASVTRTGVGVFRVVLDDALDLARDGVCIETMALDPATNIVCSFSIVDTLTVDAFFVQGDDNTVAVDPNGFTFMVFAGDREVGIESVV